MRQTFDVLRPTLAVALISLGASVADAQSSGPAAPAGWHVGSETPSRARFTLDSAVAHSGRASGRLEIAADAPGGASASANQLIQADAYRGQRVRLSGWVRTHDATAVASWVRVEGAPDGTLVAFALSTSADRPITGTAEWQRVEHVVEVPVAARAIAFGVLLRGGGILWLDDFALTPVDAATPMTNRLATPLPIAEAEEDQQRIRASWATLPSRPTNLDFERPPAAARP